MTFHQPILFSKICPSSIRQKSSPALTHGSANTAASMIYVAMRSWKKVFILFHAWLLKGINPWGDTPSIQMCCQLTYELPVRLFTRLSPASATLPISSKNYPVSLQDCWFQQILIFAGSWWQSRGSFPVLLFKTHCNIKVPSPSGQGSWIGDPFKQAKDSFHVVIFILIPAPVANDLRHQNVIVCFPHLDLLQALYLILSRFFTPTSSFKCSV